MAYIQFGNQQYYYQDLKQKLPQALPDHQEKILAFCHAWLKGESTFVRHTSGSTGQPKPIQLQRSQLEASARQTLDFLQLNQDDVALVAIPTQYIGGTMMLVRAMLANMPAIVVAPSGNPFRQLPKGIIPTFTALVPLQLEQILDDEVSTEAFVRCRHVLIGGAPVSASLEARCKALNNAVYSTYGMTETVSHVALRRISREPEEGFRLLPGIQAKTDKRDCLALCGAVTCNQWIQTNDLVAFSSPDCFRWLGRADYVINSGGIKIQPEQLENQIGALLAAEKIDASFCISSVADERLGEQLVLVLEGAAWPEEQQRSLLQKLHDYLPAYQAPKQMLFLPVFPLTETGKIQRQQIKHALS